MVYHSYIKHGLKPPKDVVYPKCNKCPFIGKYTSFKPNIIIKGVSIFKVHHNRLSITERKIVKKFQGHI